MQGGFNFSSVTGLVVAAWAGILIIPLILGGRLVAKAKQHEWYLMAGLLTLMPIVTGPIWFALWAAGAASYHPGEAFLIVLPGAVLTCIFAIRFRRCLAGPTAYTTWILLILGCLRWLNSFMIGAAPAFQVDSALFLVIGIALPTVFAAVAVYLSNKVRRPSASI